MADVWMAERVRLGLRKTVAIKLLRAAARHDPEQRRMFLDEARLSMQLNHSGIVQVFDADECDGECFMAMEWVDGLNLAQLNAALADAGQRLPLHVSTYIIGELLRALDHAHNLRTADGASIVHRDVSPQNVMLSVAGEVKLMDFGVARFASEETAGIHIKGKLRYMPPEQLRGQSRDPRVDLFAVGAVFHELLEGRVFRGLVGDAVLLAKIDAGEIPPLSAGNVVPAAIQQVLFGLLEPEQGQRIGDARTAQAMLTQWRGYQNASIELEDYIVRYRSLCLPPARSEDERANWRAQVNPISRAPGSGREVKRPTSPAFAGRDHRSVADAGVRSVWRRPPQGRFNRVAAPVVAGLGLVIGGLSVGFAVLEARATDRAEPSHWLSTSIALVERTRPIAEATVEQPPAQEAPRAAVSHPSSSPSGSPPPSTPASTEPSSSVDAGGPTPPEPPPPRPEPPQPEPELPPDNERAPAQAELQDELSNIDAPMPDEEAKPSVEVTLLAGKFRSLYVKIGGRKLTLQPLKKVRLPTGSHTLFIRANPSAPWTRIGQVKLRAGRKYELTMVKPESFVLLEVR